MSEKTNKVYYYNFSIDKINIGYSQFDDTMCFISEDIDLGELREDTYIQLSVNYDTGIYGAIEFYIVDSLNLKPILPIEDLRVINEKIFSKLEPRFSVDVNEEIDVKKNNIKVDINLYDAINSQDNNYTVSYTPINPYNVKVSNQVIKIKAILRSYDKGVSKPVINSIVIKKYGGNFIWR